MARPQYQGEHPRVRREWLARLRTAGSLPCAEPRHVRSCPRVLTFGLAVDLAHDRVNGGYLGLAWPACNRAEGARYRNWLAARRRAARRALAGSRSW